MSSDNIRIVRDKVVLERFNRDDERIKLGNFIEDTYNFKKIVNNSKHRKLLKKQYKVMTLLVDILNERISLFDEEMRNT